MAEPIRGVYKPRNPKETPLYTCLEDNYEVFKQVYDDRYEKTHGYWRAVVEEAIFAYFDCGLPQLGFALLECAGCGRKTILPFSCKTRVPCCLCCVAAYPIDSKREYPSRQAEGDKRIFRVSSQSVITGTAHWVYATKQHKSRGTDGAMRAWSRLGMPRRCLPES